MHSVVSVCPSVHHVGSHLTITHDYLDLTVHGTSVQGPPNPQTPPSGHGASLYRDPPSVLTNTRLGGHWWLERVTLVVAFGFLPQHFEWW